MQQLIPLPPSWQAIIVIKKVLAASSIAPRNGLHSGNNCTPCIGVKPLTYRYQPDGSLTMSGKNNLVACLRAPN